MKQFLIIYFGIIILMLIAFFIVSIRLNYIYKKSYNNYNLNKHLILPNESPMDKLYLYLKNK